MQPLGLVTTMIKITEMQQKEHREIYEKSKAKQHPISNSESSQ